MLFLCGVVQVFFAIHLLFDLGILQLPSNLMFIPGILIILTSIVLVISYYYGKEGINNKTWVSLGLALILICIQILWKNK